MHTSVTVSGLIASVLAIGTLVGPAVASEDDATARHHMAGPSQPTVDIAALRTQAPLDRRSRAIINQRLRETPELGEHLLIALSRDFDGTLNDLFRLSNAQRRAA